MFFLAPHTAALGPRQPLPGAAPSSTSPGQAGVRLEEADWFVSDGEQRVEADQRLESTTTTTTTTTTRMLSGSYQPR
jgi:hypothetical protein